MMFKVTNFKEKIKLNFFVKSFETYLFDQEMNKYRLLKDQPSLRTVKKV